MSKPSRRKKSFFICRGGERSGEDYVVLRSTMKIEAMTLGTSAREAEDALKEKVTGCGGNALFNYECNIDRRDTDTVYWAHGNPALIVPAAGRDEKLEKKLLEGYVDDLYIAEDKARHISVKRAKLLRLVPAIIIIGCLIALFLNR